MAFLIPLLINVQTRNAKYTTNCFEIRNFEKKTLPISKNLNYNLYHHKLLARLEFSSCLQNQLTEYKSKWAGLIACQMELI